MISSCVYRAGTTAPREHARYSGNEHEGNAPKSCPKTGNTNNLAEFLAFIRRERKQILTNCCPEAFCLLIADHLGGGPLLQQALKLVEAVTDDDRDYAIASAYALLIGREKRKALSAYFTPPPLARAALQMAIPFVDRLRSPAILDPACGGGSFVVPVTRLLIQRAIQRSVEPGEACRAALSQVRGIELDPSLAAISRRLLANMLLREYAFAMPNDAAQISVGDALQTTGTAAYDVIIGNPPFGRIGGRADQGVLAAAGRANIGRHTNIYSLFLLRALDALKPDGGLVFILPTSFVAGPYFYGLRQEILDRADLLP